MEQIIVRDGKKCTHCGRCVRMCSQGVFVRIGDRISLNITKCVNCGICVTSCPKKALTLISKE